MGAAGWVTTIEVDRRLWLCTMCTEELPTPEALGVHLERHREVGHPIYSKRGILLTTTCAKGCGRHFVAQHVRHLSLPSQQFELRAHQALCDGAPPLPRRSPA